MRANSSNHTVIDLVTTHGRSTGPALLAYDSQKYDPVKQQEIQIAYKVVELKRRMATAMRCAHCLDTNTSTNHIPGRTQALHRHAMRGHPTR